ncbi:DNA replication protein DnaD [Alicyclobacillus sacchari]|uniref:DNA replication protein DnaD n=1 Tax=Alicyclobacillus sacchari TaxID=392010 RepID=A0A4R8LV43_9BACL|nr:DnaD domain protein [Alicyclobacillus sacchari]TDY50685.1 DNA replication protein DnaD [Alicyclobacillus sacchari]GMA55664.1 hypothetical protein GCM10025858_01670 [Alicyclobacillus sacchari]
MQPSGRHIANGDFLSTPFVAVPYDLLTTHAHIGLHAHELVVLLQILANGQVRGTTELSPQDLGDLCGMSSKEVMGCVERLVLEGYLAIGEKFDEHGAHVTYFDLQPLWDRIRGKSSKKEARQFRKDPLTLFEEEFGRPLSAMECDQLRTWLGENGYPEWLVIEALKESVLANKYSFRYIDRILYDWQRHNIQSRQDLDTYRQQYRDKSGRGEVDSGRKSNAGPRNKTTAPAKSKTTDKDSVRDERYANFYQLFPDG